MNQKLTLTIENDVIKKAKQYAAINGTSISRLVENFLSLLTAETGVLHPDNLPVSETVKNWGCGITAEDLHFDKSDPKMAYLAEKYLHV